MDQNNHLANETSPYLLQHANNPVDWYPWGKEALELARRTNKPILLSIGYSACHWCHVMAHESFEDKETAAIMNHYFINIKVDREERPDLDKIYQIGLQILTGRPGGWPLTMFLTADSQLPFFGGTYFPKHPSHGLPSFIDILEKVSLFYESYSSDVEALTDKIQQALQTLSDQNTAEGVVLNKDFLNISCDEVYKEYDLIHGGFGGAPKFPHPTHLSKLIQCYYQSQEKKFLQAFNFSLTKMAQGGLYDQLGGGFFRYCVDDQWQIPHFEKMLYDNSQLIELYSVNYQMTKNEYFKTIAENSANWVIEAMQAPSGGFYSTLNADTEGEEGKYYYWDREEIQTNLTDTEFSVVERYFGLNHSPNFEGHYHLTVNENLNEIANQLSLSINEVNNNLAHAKNKLLTIRRKRVAPDCDKKILCAWNGLMIKALCIAGRYLINESLIHSAESSLTFILKHLYKNGRLLSCFKDNQAKLMGYLDDYVFLLAGIIEFLQIRWNTHYYDVAIQLADSLEQFFYDKENGGFYFTAKDHEALIQRPKSFVDESIPSGNGVAALSLIKLGYMSGNKKYLAMAEKTLQCAWRPMQQMPSAYNSLSIALESYFYPPKMVILRGKEEDIHQWQLSLNEQYYPHALMLSIPDQWLELPDSLNKPCVENKVLAYVCEGHHCLEPVERIEALLALISEE